MRSTNLNISLPIWMKKWIEKTSDERGFSNVSEFIRHTMREAWLDEKELEAEEQALLEGIRSPMSVMTQADWDDLKRPFLERIEAEKKKAA